VTRNANARIAGFAYLFYIAVAFPAMVLYNRATRGADIAAKLASMAQHVADVRLSVVLTFFSGLCALTLAVTLFALTRDQDRDLAMLGLTCRVTEGILGATSIPANLALLWIATATGSGAPEPAGARAVGAFVLHQDAVPPAAFFAVGSTLFSWLLLRGRMIPVALGWLGVVGSALIAIVLALQLAGLARGTFWQLMWLPIAVFEISVAIWWLVKGDTTPISAIRPS
jgi:hypothetical protein